MEEYDYSHSDAEPRDGPAARVLERVRMRRGGHFIENAWFEGGWGGR
jgi:hypothetical protein